MKVDSDTFLFPEHVRDYVLHKHWAYRDKHYFGRAPGPAALYVYMLGRGAGAHPHAKIGRNEWRGAEQSSLRREHLGAGFA